MKPYYKQDGITIYNGDFLDVMAAVPIRCDVAIADPPYGETSLEWDKPVKGWWRFLPCDQFWCFGSMRYFLSQDFSPHWMFVQDVVWEKHNGSNFIADRFRRVHEIIAHWRARGVKWSDLYHKTQVTPDATKRTVRRKEHPPHTGEIENSTYTSIDGGPRLMRSVIKVRSCHHEAAHPTQKPVGIISPLVAYSCPTGGVVLDPFCGSGSVLEAARLNGCQAVGIEINERWCEVAAKRMAQGLLFEVRE